MGRVADGERRLHSDGAKEDPRGIERQDVMARSMEMVDSLR